MVTQNDNPARRVEGMGYYIFEETESKRRLEGRYWNPGIECYPNLNICVVASYGAKLSEYDARHFFPDIELPYRR